MPTIWTNGCFDIIHRGHIELLQYCRHLAGPDGRVVVGINSDQSVKRLKGPDRPVNTESDRMIVLESLASVDDVLIFEADTPYEAIKSLKPDIIVKGGDYNPESVVGRDIAEVKIFNIIPGYSSSNYIDGVLLL